MENKYLVPLAIATIAIITGGVLLTQELGMKTSLQITIANAQAQLQPTITQKGDGGYEVELQNGELILTNPDTPVFVENREKPGEEILSCGQKVRLSDNTEQSVYYEGKDEDWTAALGSSWLSQAGLTQEEFGNLFKEKRGAVKNQGNDGWINAPTMTVYSGKYKYEGFVSTGLYCSGGVDKTFLGWECSDLDMPKDTEVYPAEGLEYCCNANPTCIDDKGAGCHGAWNKVTMYSDGGRLWFRNECQEPELEEECTRECDEEKIKNMDCGDLTTCWNTNDSTNHENKYNNEICAAAKKYGIDPYFLKSMLQQESGFLDKNVNSLGYGNAVGLSQLECNAIEQLNSNRLGLKLKARCDKLRCKIH